jgi:hypothetical protein
MSFGRVTRPTPVTDDDHQAAKRVETRTSACVRGLIHVTVVRTGRHG